MTRSILYARYSFFFLLVVCFAIQASVAAWDLQNEQFFHLHTQLDAFLIFCGIFGLLVVFAIAYIDLLRHDAIFVQVWFEISWLGVFFIFEIAGAAALSVIVPSLLCDDGKNISCQSARVLLGFTWTITSIVLLYFSSLTICAILHHDSQPHVWRTGVRDFPWFQHPEHPEHKRNVSWVSTKQRSFSVDSEKGIKPIVNASTPGNVERAPQGWQSRKIRKITLANHPPSNPETESQRRTSQSLPRTLYSEETSSALQTVASISTISTASYHGGTSTERFHSPALSISSTESIATTSSRRKARRTRPPPLDLSKATAYRA